MDKTYEEMVDKAVEDLNKYFSPGAFIWLEKVHPGYNARITAAEGKINVAWKQTDKKKFRDALTAWYSLVRRGMEEYRLNGCPS